VFTGGGNRGPQFNRCSAYNRGIVLRLPVGARNYSFCHTVRPGSWTNTASSCKGTEGTSCGVKRAKREAANRSHLELRVRTSGAKTSRQHTSSGSFLPLRSEKNKNVLEEHVTTHRHSVRCVPQQFRELHNFVTGCLFG
jgi:hypothetical protein